eukprot:16442375-Heterocapsa_arctica.AAC.1
MVQTIVDTFRVCRSWSSVAPRSIATATLATMFNQEVEFDLLFWETFIVLHLCDIATRFTMAVIVDNRMTDSIINAIVCSWFRVFGPPSRITSDGEGALDSEVARAWSSKWSVKINIRPKDMKAHVVERHHQLLRDLLHKVTSQMKEDGVNAPPDVILAECVFAKNALTCVHGYSPFQAVFGRSPTLLSEFEPLSEAALVDDEDGP